MDKHKQIAARMASDLRELEDHQEATFERLRQALERIRSLQLVIMDKERALQTLESTIKSLEARIEELEGEVEERIHPDDLGDYTADLRSP